MNTPETNKPQPTLGKSGRAKGADEPTVDPLLVDADEEINKSRQEDLLDEGIEETFPASDPVSVKHIT